MADVHEERDPRSFMSDDFQYGVDAFTRGAAFNTSKSEEWKDGWSFAMKHCLVRNTLRINFGAKD